MSTLLKRSATGLLIGLVIIGSISLSSLSFAILFLLVMLASLHEFYSMLVRAKIHAQVVYGMLIAAMFYVFSFLNAVGFIPIQFIFLFFPLISVIYLTELFRRENRPIHNIAFTLLGLSYIALPFSLMNYIVFHSGDQMVGTSREGMDIVNFIFQPEVEIKYHFQILLGIFFINWMNDSGAYFTGVPFGKHKLFKRISPKKSWEGFLGGAFFAMVTGVLLARFFHVLALQDWIAIAVIVVIFSTLGDLVESMLKRYLGLKDSGNILPGHGGMLDRFDGVIFSTPIIFAYLSFVLQ